MDDGEGAGEEPKAVIPSLVIKQKREANTSLFYLVPVTGIEPVRVLRRGILSYFSGLEPAGS